MCELLHVLQVSFHLQNVLSVVKLVICHVVALTTQEASIQMVLYTCDLRIVKFLPAFVFAV